MSLEEFLALPLTHWTSLHRHVQDIANHTPSQHHDHEAIQLVLKGKTKFWTWSFVPLGWLHGVVVGQS